MVNHSRATHRNCARARVVPTDSLSWSPDHLFVAAAVVQAVVVVVGVVHLLGGPRRHGERGDPLPVHVLHRGHVYVLAEVLPVKVAVSARAKRRRLSGQSYTNSRCY